MATTTSARAGDVVLSVATSSVRRRSLLRSGAAFGTRSRVYCSASSNADWSREFDAQNSDKNAGESRSAQPRYSRYSKPPVRRLKDSSKLPFPPGGGVFRLPSLDFAVNSSQDSSSSSLPVAEGRDFDSTKSVEDSHRSPPSSSHFPSGPPRYPSGPAPAPRYHSDPLPGPAPAPRYQSDPVPGPAPAPRYQSDPGPAPSPRYQSDPSPGPAPSPRYPDPLPGPAPSPRYYSKPYRRVRANLPLGAHELPSFPEDTAANPPLGHLQPPASASEHWKDSSQHANDRAAASRPQARNSFDDFSSSSLPSANAQGRHLQPGPTESTVPMVDVGKAAQDSHPALEPFEDSSSPFSSPSLGPSSQLRYSRYSKPHRRVPGKLPLGVHHLGSMESLEKLDSPTKSSLTFSKEESTANPHQRHFQPSPSSTEHLDNSSCSPPSSLPSLKDQAVPQAHQSTSTADYLQNSMPAPEHSGRMSRQKARGSSKLPFPPGGSIFRSYGTDTSSSSPSAKMQGRHFHFSAENSSAATTPSHRFPVSGEQPPWSTEQFKGPTSSSEAAADLRGQHLQSPPWATKHLEEQRDAPRVLPPNMAHLGRKHLELPTSRNPNRLETSMYGPQRLQQRSTEPPTYELPFEFQYTYSEVPKVEPVAERGPQFSPFGPDSMPRPWCGKAPLPKSRKPPKVIDSFNPPPDKKGMKPVEAAGPFPPGQRPVLALTREDVMGEPLSREEVAELVDACRKEKRQLNIGRDGVTHNMLDVIHNYWKRRRVIKIKCKGVPTIDIENLCFHLEDKTGGKIIFRHGGSVFLFRGRNYNPRFRPHIPIMLWKPPVPIYPQLVQHVPEGLTYHQAELLRKRGRLVKPLKRLLRNGVYLNLAEEVREAFEIDELVKLDCRRMNPSDIRKIGAKLKEILGIVVLSFQDEQVLLWRGPPKPTEDEKALQEFISDSANDRFEEADTSNDSESKMEPVPPTPAQVRAAQDLDALWQRAVDFGMVTTLDDEQLDPDTVKAIAGAPVKLKRDEEESYDEEEVEKKEEAQEQVRVIEKDERVIQQAYKTLERKLSTSVRPPSVGVLPVDELAKLLASPS